MLGLCVSLSCSPFASSCHSLSLAVPISEGSVPILTWEVHTVPPACPHCQIGLGSWLGLPNLVELTLQLPRAACLAELSPADVGAVEERGLHEEWCVAGCYVTGSPQWCSVAGGCRCHVVPVGRGLPARSQAHSRKAAGCHPEACDVLWATEVGRDKPTGSLERVSRVYR